MKPVVSIVFLHKSHLLLEMASVCRRSVKGCCSTNKNACQWPLGADGPSIETTAPCQVAASDTRTMHDSVSDKRQTMAACRGCWAKCTSLQLRHSTAKHKVAQNLGRASIALNTQVLLLANTCQARIRSIHAAIVALLADTLPRRPCLNSWLLSAGLHSSFHCRSTTSGTQTRQQGAPQHPP